jgi:hypothetical protein
MQSWSVVRCRQGRYREFFFNRSVEILMKILAHLLVVTQSLGLGRWPLGLNERNEYVLLHSCICPLSQLCVRATRRVTFQAALRW